MEGTLVSRTHHNFKFALGPLRPDLVQPGGDILALGFGQDTRPHKGLGVSLAALNIFCPHAAIEPEGVVELFHHRVGVGAESPAPQPGLLRFLPDVANTSTNVSFLLSFPSNLRLSLSMVVMLSFE